MAEQKKQRKYTYRAFAQKGSDFNFKLDKGEEEIIDANGLRKPNSSNTKRVVLDTGNAYVPGKCYDHHQLSQEKKLEYPSATSMIYASRRSFYEYHKEDESMEFVCHQYPDNDAILSVTLASLIMDAEGATPLVAKELVEWANKSDTYNYDLGFNFGAFLDYFTKEVTPSRKNSTPNLQRDAIEKCVGFTRDIIACYNDMVRKEPDPEKRAKITLNTVVENIATNKGEYFNYVYGRNFFDSNGRKIFRVTPKDIKKELNDNAQNAQRTFKTMIDSPKTSTKLADEKRDKNNSFGAGIYGYDTFDVKLCKRQITSAEQQCPFESQEKKSKVFVYTGSRKISPDMALLAKKQFDATIIPTYNKETNSVTYKISTGRDDVDLAHFGRYIETMIYRENLEQKDSTIKTKKEFEERKEKFIESKKPLDENTSKKHFTTFDSICGNDPTFFGFTVDSKSNLYNTTTVVSYMKDYFDNPQKIREDEFVSMIGKEHFDELNAHHRPELFKEANEENDIDQLTDEEIESLSNEEIDEILNDDIIEDDIDNSIEETEMGDE